MALRTFDEFQTLDRPTGRPLASLLATVVDHVTGAPVVTYDLEGNEAPVITNRWGITPAFQADADIARVSLGGSTFIVNNIEGSIGLVERAESAETAAQTAADAADSAAALVGAPAKAAMDAAMGGDVAGLVPKVTANTVDITKLAPKLEFYPDANIPTPWVISHRGGLAVYPESSVLGYDASARDGFAIEADIQTLADGRIVVMHDLTADRTMIGATGPVSALTSQQWESARLKPVLPGGVTARPLFFDEFLARYGGRVPLVIELKAGTPGPVIEAVTRRGLERAVVMQSSTYAHCEAFVAAGMPAMLLFSPGVQTITPDPSTIAAAGIRYVGVPVEMPAAQISAAAAAGLKVVVYTVNTRAGLADMRAKGAAGVFSDDPWYVADRIAYQSGPDLAAGVGWPGMRARTGAGLTTPWRPALTPGGIESFKYSESAANILQTLDLPQLGPVTRGTFTIAFRAHFYPEAAAQTTSIGFYLWQNGTSPDAQFVDGANPGQNGFTVLARRSGIVQAYKYVNGAAAASLGVTVATTEFAPAGKLGVVDVRVKFTPTQVLLDASTGTSLVIPDTFLANDMRFGLRWSGTDGAVRDLRVIQQ